MKLYYHKTDGGAEYLTDKFVKCPDGSKEGVFKGASIIVRIDGNLSKDAEVTLGGKYAAAPDLLKACKLAVAVMGIEPGKAGGETILAAIAAAEGR